jgi:long-chain-fatty-acid--CoA ligase ACSBG
MPKESKISANTGVEISLEALEKMASLAYKKRGQGIHWTSSPDMELPVKVALDPNDSSSQTPITVIECFQECVAKHGSATAMRVERDGKWQEWTFEEYFDDCCRIAKSLIKIGLSRFGCCVVMGFNSPEWFLADLGTIFAGGIASGIYTTNGVEATHYIAEHCRAEVAFVENDEQVQKFLACREKLPHLKAIVQWSGPVRKNVPGLMSWGEFLGIGESVNDVLLQDRITAQKPGHCCTLIYTSGTTGKPKAVMLSHDNVTWTARTTCPLLQLGDNERIVSYLPLSHIAAQLTDLHGPLVIGGCVSFARPDALKGSLVETLNAVRPTVFLGVPRVWEKIEEKMRAVGAANTGVIKRIGDWAKGVGLQVKSLSHVS